MGAMLIERQARGSTIAEALKEAKNHDEHEHGHDYYNGALNNCNSGFHDVTGRMGRDTLRKYMSEQPIEKGVVYGLCISKPVINKNKVKSEVKRYPQKGARRWITLYEVTEKYSDRKIASEDTLTKAIKKARFYTEKTQLATAIYIVKELKVGNSLCASVGYKKSKTEKLGTYMFMSWAPV